MSEAIASGGAVATEVARQTRAHGNRPDAPVRKAVAATSVRPNRPDAPVREAVAATAVRPNRSDAPAPDPQKPGERTARPQSSAQPRTADSALTTYKDSDSGRLIIRIFDRETGDVILEFPPEDPPTAPGLPAGGASLPPSTRIDV